MSENWKVHLLAWSNFDSTTFLRTSISKTTILSVIKSYLDEVKQRCGIDDDGKDATRLYEKKVIGE